MAGWGLGDRNLMERLREPSGIRRDEQAESWCNGQAADRRCAAEPERTVREVFAEEVPLLLRLPDNRPSVYECVQVSVGKTPHVRFD